MIIGDGQLDFRKLLDRPARQICNQGVLPAAPEFFFTFFGHNSLKRLDSKKEMKTNERK
jgi:hypothetical protein